jgi:hypothetical protein
MLGTNLVRKFSLLASGKREAKNPLKNNPRSGTFSFSVRNEIYAENCKKPACLLVETAQTRMNIGDFRFW